MPAERSSFSALIEQALSPVLDKLPSRLRDPMTGHARGSKAHVKPLTTGEAAAKLQAVARGHATRRAAAPIIHRPAPRDTTGAPYPMLVIPISALLQLDSLHAFEELKEREGSGMGLPFLLLKYNPGMKVVYVSQHAWMGDHGPDPLGLQFGLLKYVLRRMSGMLQSGGGAEEDGSGGARRGGAAMGPSLGGCCVGGGGGIRAGGDIRWEAIVEGHDVGTSRLRARRMRSDLGNGNGYVFLEHCCVPQAVGEAASRARRLALASVPSYIACSSYVLALVGPSWRHATDGHIMDKDVWSSRGRVRLEMLCNHLQPGPRPVVLARSPASVTLIPSSGLPWVGWTWLLSPPGMGQVATSDEAPRLLGPVIAAAIRLATCKALEHSDLHWFRLLHALTPLLLEGTGLEGTSAACEAQEDVAGPDIKEEELAVAGQLAALHLSSATDSDRQTGMTPLHYAVLTVR